MRRRHDAKPIARLSGIDVSAFQGAIDWTEVAVSGRVAFAYARAFHSKSPGTYGDDAMLSANWEGCKRAGIPVGAYLFFIAAQDGKSQARHLAELVGGRAPDLAPVIDVEEGSGVQGWGASVGERIANLMACCEELTSLLGQPMVYTNLDTWKSFFGSSPKFSRFRLWVADPHGPPGEPTHVPPGWTTWTVHQYGTGSIPGINGHVDLDVIKGSDSEAIRVQG